MSLNDDDLAPEATDWDTDEPTLTTGLSALLAEEMRAQSGPLGAHARAKRPNDKPPTSSHPVVLGVLWGTLAGLLSAWTFASSAELESSHEATPHAARQIHFVDVPASTKGEGELSVEGRARSGDRDALDYLRERREGLTSTQLLAVVEGEMALEARSLDELGDKPDVLVRMSEGVRPKLNELKALSELPGGAAADALYEVWAVSLKTPAPATETQQLAHQLLFAPDVRSRASDALDAALALYDVEDCASARAAMTHAELVGDRRSAHGIQQVAGGSACDDDDRECQRCVEHRSLTHRAYLAVRERPVFLSWRRPNDETRPTPTSDSEPQTTYALAIKETHD